MLINKIKTIIFILLGVICILWIIAVGVLFWSLKTEQRLIMVNRQTLYVPDKNNQLEGLKIAVLSDLHLGSPYIDRKKLEKIIYLTNREKPDLIFILGDIDAKAVSMKYRNDNHIINCFKKLNAAYGTYAIYGNHDFTPQNVVEPILKRSNIPLIVDNFVKIKTKSGICNIVGLNDSWGHNTEKSILNITSKIPFDEPIIVLVHNPDVFPKVPQRVSLTISGHNHGGQICLPILGGLFIPSKYGQRYLKGYIVENNKHLYVSSGIGNSAPLRFGNIPEINILTLHSQTKKTLIINTKPRTGIKNLMGLYPKIKNSKFYSEWFYIFLN